MLVAFYVRHNYNIHARVGKSVKTPQTANMEMLKNWVFLENCYYLRVWLVLIQLKTAQEYPFETLLVTYKTTRCHNSRPHFKPSQL